MSASGSSSRKRAREMGLDENELLDPHPDIHALFCHYNSVYFHDSLGSCVVQWSSPRMTSCAGTCRYLRGGGCEIHLSEPLLKFRPTADLKNTLLHEMIHAFLFITKKKRDHSDHGPNFQTLMNAINFSSITDHQRPSGGYNITIYHDFHEEVDSYRVHHWICESCGDLIKRAMNRKPSASDCIQNMGHIRACGNFSCHWHRHRISCNGSYAKIAEPPGYKDKRRDSKGTQKLIDSKSKKSNVAVLGQRGSRSSKGMKDKSDVPKSNAITKFFRIEGDSKANLDSRPSSKSVVVYGRLKGTALKSKTPSVALDTEKQVKPLKSEKRKCGSTSIKKSPRGLNEFTVISEWLEYYADEEMDEDIEPLINKRTERRKKHKMLKSPIARSLEAEDVRITFLGHPSSFRKGAERSSLLYHKNSELRTPKYLAVEHVSSINRLDSTTADTSDQSASLQLVSLSAALPMNSPIQDNVVNISDDSS
ncbi:uncharacterized protein [Typha angustifolia]|uniref:uncharacterized protein n=1 Tax=Typha angustifolia TaxID=59011 RepID=UPI003C2FB8A8